MKSRHSSERGAVVIQVAVFLLFLMAFSAFVVDYGVLWVARGQAQNAADSGALAAAVNLEFNPSNTAQAIDAAKSMAGSTPVWTENTAPANVLVETGLPCPPGSGGGPGCVRVDVMRGAKDRANLQHTNTLPTFFATLVGVGSQAIKATAMAQVTSGNAVTCIKPWIVADKWIDNNEPPIGGWAQGDTYSPPVDTYTAPGFKPDTDTGLELVLKEGAVGTWSSGWTQQIDFDRTGSSAYSDEIAGCPDWVPTVAIYDPTYPCSSRGDTADPSRGCVSVKTGMAAGPTKQGVDDLVAKDPSAYWNGTTVAGGCMDAGNCDNPASPNLSPRIAPIAVFNTQQYYNEANGGACNGTTCVAQVVNLMGFFLEGMCDEVYPNPRTRPSYCGSNAEARKAVVGRLMQYPGQILTSGGSTTSSFARAVRLVR
jgi:Flp pilus assembly protein TadG